MDTNLDIKEKIKKINLDKNLSITDKNKKINELLNNNFKNNLLNLDYCNHYPNKLCNNFYFSCCDNNKNYCCKRCHNEENNHLPIVTKISCIKCNKIQEPSNLCINRDCNIIFSKNYCNKDAIYGIFSTVVILIYFSFKKKVVAA